jgi:hypothetical protein
VIGFLLLLETYLVSDIKGGIWIEGVSEQAAEENISTEEK